MVELNQLGSVGRLMYRGTQGPSAGPKGFTEAEQLAYQHRFQMSYIAGAIQYPELVPTPPKDTTGRPQSNGAQTNLELWVYLKNWTKPVLLAFWYK